MHCIPETKRDRHCHVILAFERQASLHVEDELFYAFIVTLVCSLPFSANQQGGGPR